MDDVFDKRARDSAVNVHYQRLQSRQGTRRQELRPNSTPAKRPWNALL